MPRALPPHFTPPLSLFATLDLARLLADIEATIEATYATPWYWPVPERNVVRVLDGPRLNTIGRDPAALGAWQVAKVAAVLTAVIGQPPVRGVPDGKVVELQVPPQLFAAAALALRMEYRCLALESAYILKLVCDHRPPT